MSATSPEPLLTIGAFARAVGLSASTLRHYDECGLLRPAEVDDLTGYRYYTPDLAERARLVAVLREAGLSIAQMGVVLDGDADARAEVVRAFLSEQEARSALTAALLTDLGIAAEQPAGAAAPVRLAVRGPELAAAVRQVRAAADGDATSPLGAVLLDAAGRAVDVVATNRYWMAVRTLPLDAPHGDARVALSLVTASRLAERLDSLDDVVVELGDTGVRVDGHHLAALTTPYPAHRLVVAGLDVPVVRALLPRSALEAALEAVGRAEVVWALDEGGLVVEGRDHEAGHAVGGTVTGPAMRIKLATALVRRALDATLGPEVEVRLSSPNRPVRIGSPYQRGFVALVMPFRLD